MVRLTAKVRDLTLTSSESRGFWTISLDVELTERPRRQDHADKRHASLAKELLNKRVVIMGPYD
jgi:hypothetical protein